MLTWQHELSMIKSEDSEARLTEFSGNIYYVARPLCAPVFPPVIGFGDAPLP